MSTKIDKTLLSLAKKFVRYKEVLAENQQLKKDVKPFGFPVGHYYSPVHNLDSLKNFDAVKEKACSTFAKTIPGFSEKTMLKQYDNIKKYFMDFDYPEEENDKNRFYIKNSSYPITDALVLFSLIRSIKPKRIIEIGSGFTSALMMDVNQRFFDNKIEITFIEPYPRLLYKRMTKADKDKYRVIATEAQSVPLKTFKDLAKDDFLFIDSTHVSKFNSDVNYELFDILPVIQPGVIIHFHDIFDGFVYPLGWLKQGWAWNEDYILRAFLINNPNYEVLLMNDYLTNRYPKLLLDSYPRVTNLNGGSLWIRKK